MACLPRISILLGRRVGAAVLLALPAAGAFAQAPAWPDKPVRLVVPYSAGGTTDYAARQIAQKLSDATGKSFFVENKTGASGTIATQDVVRSTPDGSNFLVTDTTYTMLPLLFAKLPWNYRSDLVHVTGIIETPVVLVVPEKSPFKTLQDLVAHARAHPGKLNFGSGGPASSTHLSAEVFKSDAKVFITHIPYRGAGAAMADVMAGQIDLLITAAPTAIPQVKGGRVRALATTGDRRLQALPDVPTFAEAGLPSYQVVNWFGLAAPKGTPAPVIEKLHALVASAMTDPAMQASMAQQGASYRPMTVRQFGDFVNKEVAVWAEAGRRAGLKPESSTGRF
ncbi:tripartite tricarboxylate transporter substrate binding protein [uncultured Xylophilus sp.]|uniref:Bug family tripartite tricarboxylate transporter substrate binding protein n=1 Tax=uncultured Xylophilus sp. TaxID=296832 RepID=UPI0025EBE018|nr:tripartite tricarboxylate transporter substrate binding protein [uncultured Xylophilus sp.]